MTDNFDYPFMFRWLAEGTKYAGALDDIGPLTGLGGWVLSRDAPQRRFEVQVVSGGRVLARTVTSKLRLDLSELVGERVSCGFAFPWSEFDLPALRDRIRADPDATFEIFVPETESYLRKFSEIFDIESVRLGECLVYVGQARDIENALVQPAELAPEPDGGAVVAEEETQTAFVERITRSGLVDPIYYRQTVRDLASSELSAAEHYFRIGEALGYRPNPYFDPKWYAYKYMSKTTTSGALRQYLETGERAGEKPSPVFEPLWYARTYAVDLNIESALAHYLVHRNANNVNPNRYFDVDFYLKEYPDIQGAQVDAFTHWIRWGLFEGRVGSPDFKPYYVWQRYLGNNRQLNAFEAFMDVGAEFGWSPSPDAAGITVHRIAAANSAQGPQFEKLGPPVATPTDAAKVIALYLPQFHPIPENDAWWGDGFTEWTNLPRGQPRYVGHMQPRIPRDLGFYSLKNSDALRRQTQLARRAGVHGFCFYYYNFNGKRLLEAPVEAFLAEKDIDFPFCLMWANENWTRRWDGSESEVLIGQNYLPEDMTALVDDIARHMLDSRYMRSADGRPMFFVYRADVIPDGQPTLAAWRERFRKVHKLNPLFVMSQTFGVEDPRPYGFDGAIEFPPHKIATKLPPLNDKLQILDPDFSGSVRDYNAMVEASLAVPTPPYPLIKTAFPSWDNDSRRQGKGMSFANSTPIAFQEWMAALLGYAAQHKFFGESLVFVNAWNEWCEGAYLEPDTHFGYAYINAVSRALQAASADSRRIVLVGHDAFPSGAQHLLLHMGATLKRRFGLELKFVLLEGGELVGQYKALAPTFVASEHANVWDSLRGHLTALKGEGFRYALTNTVAAGGATIILDELNFSFGSLVHELPALINSKALAPAYAEISRRSRTIVYPNAFVKDKLDAAFGAAIRPTIIRPQGLYNPPSIAQSARADVRSQLGINPNDKIVLNIGYADLRKGIDLFVSFAEQFSRADKDVHFVWLGDVHPDIEPWLKLDIQRRGLRNLHIVPFSRDIGRYLGAADLFLLTSREDPFPSVILEAFAAGLPVAAFEDSGGHVEILRADPRLGALMPFDDMFEAVFQIRKWLRREIAPKNVDAEHRSSMVAERFSFGHYCADLMRILDPKYRTVSVVVPSYNYARYLPDRLQSLFAQNYPVYEVLVLDDGSQDDSAAVAQRIADEAGRLIQLDVNASNSGNVFRQWKKGLDQAKGEFIWIAEADDRCDASFLGEVIRRLAADPDAAFCFTDSRAIGPDGDLMYESYKEYYNQLDDHGLDQDGRFEGKDFLKRFLTVRNHILNASSVVWRTASLRGVFETLGEEAFALHCAGDWRIYVEACRQAKAILYVAEPLNHHRRHDQSVTHALDTAEHMREIVYVQDIALKGIPEGSRLRQQVATWQIELRRTWGLDSKVA